MRAVLAGPGARRALWHGRRGVVVTAVGTGGYLRFADDFVLLAPVRAPAGPLSVLVAGLRGLVPGASAEVDGEVLDVRGTRVTLAAARTVAAVRQARPAPGWRQALAAALATVPPPPGLADGARRSRARERHGVARGLSGGLRALHAGDLDAATALLAGRGDGLTPVGDDVLAGYAAWRWAVGARVDVDAAGCSPLGRAYLRCAERGELPAPAAGVLEAVRAGDAGLAARRAPGVRAWGASSGAALLWGMAAGAGPSAP